MGDVSRSRQGEDILLLFNGIPSGERGKLKFLYHEFPFFKLVISHQF